jgi:predicted metalloprotease with PDZ domain
MIGAFGFTDDDFAAAIGRIVAGERRFWGRREGPFLVVLAPLGGMLRGTASRGEGRGDAFAIQTTPNNPLHKLAYVLAHEYFHSWNPARLGGMDEGAREAESYWFSEGFTDFYARRLLLRIGAQSLDAFVADWNKALTEYAESPVRLAPNDAIASRFWKEADVHNLPYLRGAIMAARWDAALRRASHGHYTLDDVMRAMRDRARKGGPRAPDLFEATARHFGLDIGPERRAVIDAGGPALLPPDAFGACLRVTTTSLPRFDRGFDIRATRGNHNKLVGLEPGGPAERAGLREGMEIEINEAPSNDSRKLLTYAHRRDDGTVEHFTFLPQGHEMTTLQQIEIPSGLTPAERLRCAAEASGAPFNRLSGRS